MTRDLACCAFGAGSIIVVNGSGRSWRVLAALAWLASVVHAVPARAREDGAAVEDCSGCHNGSSDRGAMVTVSANPAAPTPGQTVRLTVAVVGGTAAGLFFKTTPNVGQLSAVTGQSTKLVEGGIVHSAPKAASGGTTTFAIDWKAPSAPGDVELFAYAIAANRDGRSSGDGYGMGYLSLVFGCTGAPFYADYDLDGHGGVGNVPRMACSAPESYAPVSGDCDDYDANVHPGAGELCNGKDDDCNGQVDEGLSRQMYCADADGDGHGVSGGATKLDCGPRDGFGACDNDCDDGAASVYPGAVEQCNYKDDNCNGRVDENARLSCGIGWCRRSSESCNADLCVPGDPMPETCNALDDDCDGDIDEGALCPNKQVCSDGACVAASDVGKPRDAGTGRDGSSPPDIGTQANGANTSDAGQATTSSETGCTLGPRPAAPWLLLLLALRRRRRAPAARR